MLSDVETDLRLLLTDLDYLQKAIDKLDSHRFQIKSWSITTAGALLAVAFGTQLPIVTVVGLVTTFFFAFLEVYYVATQADVIARSNEVERYINLLREGHRIRTGDYSFGISRAFFQPIRFRRTPRLIFSKGRIHITIFYFGLLFVMLLGSISTMIV
jgi:hypothetical protein